MPGLPRDWKPNETRFCSCKEHTDSVQCPRCDGTGKRREGFIFTKVVECQYCDGRGDLRKCVSCWGYLP